MPTRRNPIHRGVRVRIGPDAARLWKRILEIEADGQHENWEEDGGKREEYLAAELALGRLLGLKPWEPVPNDREPRDPLRVALDAAAGRSAA